MRNIASRSFVACLALPIVLAGCSGGASTSTASSSAAPGGSKSVAGGGSADVDTAPYPAWIQAIVPPYPNVSAGYLMDQKGGYVFESKDSFDTIAAWYKSHVNGTWTTDAASGNVTTTANGLKIVLVKDQLNSPPLTMIQLSHG